MVSIGGKRRSKEVKKIDQGWSSSLHFIRCKDKGQKLSNVDKKVKIDGKKVRLVKRQGLAKDNIT
jgi:hypothetical protein